MGSCVCWAQCPRSCPLLVMTPGRHLSPWRDPCGQAQPFLHSTCSNLSLRHLCEEVSLARGATPGVFGCASGTGALDGRAGGLGWSRVPSTALAAGSADWEAQAESPCQPQDARWGLECPLEGSGAGSLTSQGGRAQGRALRATAERMDPAGAPHPVPVPPRPSRRPGCPGPLPKRAGVSLTCGWWQDE